MLHFFFIFQPCIQLLVILLNKNKIRSHYFQMNLFWKLNDVKIEETYKAKMVKSYELDLLPLKFYYYMAVSGQVLYFYNLICNVDSRFLEFLPMKLRFSYYIMVFRVLAIVLQFWGGSMIVAFTTVVVYSCLILNTQFQMLSQRMKIIINEEGYKKRKLVICIKYHNFLLRHILCY